MRSARACASACSKRCSSWTSTGGAGVISNNVSGSSRNRRGNSRSRRTEGACQAVQLGRGVLRAGAAGIGPGLLRAKKVLGGTPDRPGDRHGWRGRDPLRDADGPGQRAGPLSSFCDWTAEQDHRHAKRLVRPGLGFGGFRTARRTLAGHAMLAMVRKGQVRSIGGRDMQAQAAFVTALFVVAA